jgi:uncharacterized OB-fold protein
MQIRPELTPENTGFWTGGAKGELRITFCDACNHAIHPPELTCPVCLGRDTTPRAVTGNGTIYSFTINRQKWAPDMVVPFALAVVDLDDAPGVRITAKLVGVDVDAVKIGDPVEVLFEQNGDVWIPQFRPRD